MTQGRSHHHPLLGFICLYSVQGIFSLPVKRVFTFSLAIPSPKFIRISG
jgi:hypothetical protein